MIGLDNLPTFDAACSGRWDLFDEAHQNEPAEDVEYRHRTAARICQRCPALTECGQWADQLPKRDRPSGVLAGVIPAARRTHNLKGNLNNE